MTSTVLLEEVEGRNAVYSAEQLTGTDLDQAAANLEYMFTQVLHRNPTGQWSVDSAKAAEAQIAPRQAEEIAIQLNLLEAQMNDVDIGGSSLPRGFHSSDEVQPQHKFGSEAYVGCLLNAVRGGVAGLAAALAGAAGWCATPWAK